MNIGEDVMRRTLAVLEEGRRAGLHLGAQLYVSHHGRVIADFALGENAPGQPLAPDTRMLWLSAVKPVTALAIAQLWEQGRVHLDDPVARLLPEFAQGGKSAITLRHLLTHTGGIRPADQVPDTLDWAATLDQIYRVPLEPGWEPGKKAGYHLHGSWFVLGEIVHRLSGLPLPRYLRERIFEPLGMDNCWLGLPPEQFHADASRRGLVYLLTTATGLRPHPVYNTESSWTACRPGSNGRGPIRELGRLYEYLLAAWTNSSPGQPFLRPETIRLFTSRQRVGMFDHTFKHVIDWGFGFIPNSRRYGADTVPYGYGTHAGEASFGHSGSQSSCAFADPERGLVVAWVCNGLPGEPRHQARARALNTSIYEDVQPGIV